MSGLEYKENISLLKVTKKSVKNTNYSFELLYDSRKSKTEDYDPKLYVLRRGTTLQILYECLEKMSLNKIGLRLETMARDKRRVINIETASSNQEYFDFKFMKKEHKFQIDLNISVKAPIGLYHISLTNDGKSITESLPLYIIFNPLNPDDPTQVDNKVLIDEYLLHPTTKVHFGSSDRYGSRTYQLGQFSLEAIAVSNIYLGRMKLKERCDPVFVSRAITSFVNSNDNNGLIAGNWGKITEGTSPCEWVNMKDIFKEYLKIEGSVKWGQCFVFAGLVTSLCRNIGIICRAVTGFSIGHDNDDDGILTIYLSDKTLENLRNSETLWNFHCWNNVWIKRNDISVEISDNSKIKSHWQHIDGTPQETSAGIYQCGPFPVGLLRNHVFETVRFDGKPVYFSINAVTEYIILNDKEETVKKYKKYEAGKLLLSSSRYEKNINITSEYKIPKLKPDVDKTNKVAVKLTVDEKVSVDQPLKYKISVTNTSDSKTVICLVLNIKNNLGKRMLEDYFSKSFVFEEKNKEFEDEFNFNLHSIDFNPSISYASWELRFFDQALNKVKVITKFSVFKPILSGEVKKHGVSWSPKLADVIITVTNNTKIELNDIKIVVFTDRKILDRKHVVENFKALETKEIKFSFTDLKLGYHKVCAYAQSDILYEEIGSTKIMVA